MAPGNYLYFQPAAWYKRGSFKTIICRKKAQEAQKSIVLQEFNIQQDALDKRDFVFLICEFCASLWLLLKLAQTQPYLMRAEL